MCCPDVLERWERCEAGKSGEGRALYMLQMGDQAESDGGVVWTCLCVYLRGLAREKQAEPRQGGRSEDGMTRDGREQGQPVKEVGSVTGRCEAAAQAISHPALGGGRRGAAGQWVQWGGGLV